MNKLMTMTRQFRDDENGAAMVEYTILLGLIAAATIATIIVVAGWITGTWGALCDTLNTAGNGVTCVTPA
ncbi:Flp family type IVb pilin [Mesorhizobium sp. BR1-1-3]|uniref:Flp family type IVb pilin n=1 Tax=Mesorhizobium sp. BR1-1-3 TaxID=2876651 RepID=UPI001CD125F1|nr:Flp family type IVb pilin [Mesorhizobium sp. BR1-1-3]MBZ9891746.1 Flp family type IVb pilin [Mesorhizobium sp. BR1-1-3]